MLFLAYVSTKPKSTTLSEYGRTDGQTAVNGRQRIMPRRGVVSLALLVYVIGPGDMAALGSIQSDVEVRTCGRNEGRNCGSH